MSDMITLPDGREMERAIWQGKMEQLRAPFAADEIEKLPKQLKRNDDARYKCQAGTPASADGHYCGGFHARSLHLDYVGHAGITERLNSVDPQWNWEPMALTPAGTPLFSDGGMWGRLTILGVSRIGFGDAGDKTGPNATKEVIGDFLRNAAMRFGVATYLWSKSESALERKRAEEEAEPQQERPKPGPPPQSHAPRPPRRSWSDHLEQAGTNVTALKSLRKMATDAKAPEGFLAEITKRINENTPLEGPITNG